MKIIDIGICTDDVDPKGIGRIRAVRYSDYVGEKEKSLTYAPWDDRDPFVCAPFLPPNINFIPEKGQAVKIINFNTDKDTVNQEYIAGPFTTMFDFNGQTFSQQVENTSYGAAVKHSNDIINKNGNYRDPRSESSFAKTTDYGVYGKYGSDIIFTENGLQIRGGKLVSKTGASSADKKTMMTYPIMSDKSARIYLKKFPKKMVLSNNHIITTNITNSNLNYIVEYTVDNLMAPTLVGFDVYSVDKNYYGQDYNTAVFNSTSPLNPPIVKHILGTSGDTHTFSVVMSGINGAYLEIIDILHSLHEDGLLKTINNLRKRNIISGYNPSYSSYPDENMHPFYFRPTSELLSRTTTDIENTNRQIILNNVNVCRVGPTNGLVYSLISPNPPVTNVDSIKEYSKVDPSSKEQSFGAVVADKFYLLSTDNTNKTDKTIDFNKLNRYEYTQEDYIEKIDPNTYSLVRGEILIEFLKAMYNVMLTHKHNLHKPYARTEYSEHEHMESLFKKLENDLINGSVRIN